MFILLYSLSLFKILNVNKFSSKDKFQLIVKLIQLENPFGKLIFISSSLFNFILLYFISFDISYFGILNLNKKFTSLSIQFWLKVNFIVSGFNIYQDQYLKTLLFCHSFIATLSKKES